MSPELPTTVKPKELSEKFVNLQLSTLNGGLVGESDVMQALSREIAMAAGCNLTALIVGESGTGKELVARAIHTQSARATKPFISINCGALTETLLESELFGYVRGAFTGAIKDRQGLFEVADTGTLFLDEIGEMSVSSQVKLLRALQEGAFRPVGGLIEVPVDVRVVAATNRNLAQEIGLGRFRQDLFYRLAVLTISTPALRQRVSDVPSLLEYFLHQTAEKMKRGAPNGIEEEAVAALALYTWPGNVRQLRHVVERLVAGASEGRSISARTVHQVLNEVSRFEIKPHVPTVFRDDDQLDEFLARTLLGLYNHFLALTGNHSEVARILGIHRNSLYQRVDRARQRVQGNGNGSYRKQDWSD